MDQLRILILDTSPIRRGAQVFAEELAECLVVKGYPVKRIYLFQPVESQLVSLRAQDVVFPFFEDSIYEKFPTFQPCLLLALKREIESFQPQIILCNGSKTLKYGAWLQIFGFANQSKVSGRFIDDAIFWNEKGIKKRAYSYWLSRFDGMVSVSQASAKSMISHYQFQKPSTVIHRVFDPKKFENAPSREEARAQLGISEKEEVLLFLGNLTAQKRPDRFMEIVSRLYVNRPNLKVLIVGDGPMREELENQKARDKKREARSERRETRIESPKDVIEGHGSDKSKILDLASFVYFTGYQQDVAPYLAAAELLVLTSDTEGLPGVVLEAAHFGVPCVATEIGGISECLVDGETGMLIPDRSVAGFCEKIIFLLDHPLVRKSMGHKAKTFIAENFQMEKVSKQYLDFFRSISKR